MQGVAYRYAFCFFYFLLGADVSGRSASQTVQDLLKSLQDSDPSRPVLLLINPGSKAKSSKLRGLLSNLGNGLKEVDRTRHDSTSSSSSSTSSSEEDVHLLRNFARQGKDTPAQPASYTSEEQKEALRTALRSRCNKVKTCQRQCPPQKPSCPGHCQKIFDDLNLCPETTTTTKSPCEADEKPKCGKGRTMPPRWKF